MTELTSTDSAESRTANPSAGHRLARLWSTYQNSAVPLGLKWSLAIGTLIVVAMGVLGFHLIQQQELVYRDQADRYSAIIVDQLLRVSGEPLMAGDSLSLQLLLQRNVQNPLILGAELVDNERLIVAEAGVSPREPEQGLQTESGDLVWEWESAEHHAVSYRRPVLFQDVVAGYLTVSFDRQPLERGLTETLQFLFLSTVLLIGLGILFSFALAYRLSRPIQHLARAGEALAAGGNLGGERRDEIGQVLASFQHLAAGYRRKNDAEAALSRYVSPHVAQKVLADDGIPRLQGHRAEGSVLFCDIVGFTRLSENRDPSEVAEMLNHYFGYFAVAAESCNGTVDNFIGDAIMIVFGVSTEDPHHALHAMTCGLLIQQLTERINRRRESVGDSAIGLRVGISSGAMMAGDLGSAARMQYTVVGDTVNVAARLCAMAEPGGVLLTESVLARGHPGSLANYAKLGPARLRGRSADVEVRAMDVAAVAHEIDADRLIERILSGEAA